MEDVASAVKLGILSVPKYLPFWYMYDKEGCTRFDESMEFQHYYMSRSELEILRNHAKDIVDELPSPGAVVDLGCGNASKTRLLIDEVLQRQASLTYYPVDISVDYLQEQCALLSEQYGNEKLKVVPIPEDFDNAIKSIRQLDGDKLIICFGTLQNFLHDQQIQLLKNFSTAMSERDRMILSLDITQDEDAVKRAYRPDDDYTKDLPFNALLRLNREFGNGEIDTTKFRLETDMVVNKDRCHTSFVQRVFISTRDHTYNIRALGITLDFKEGEKMYVSGSHKYTEEQVEYTVAKGNLRITRMWKDKKSHVGMFCLQTLQYN